MLSWCSICPRRPLQGKLLSSRLRVCFTGITPLRGSLRAAFTGVPLSFWLSLPYQEQPDTCNGDSRSLRYTEGLGVPVAVAIIRIEVLANDYSVFKDQWKGSPPIRSGKSPLTNSHWERPNGYPENEKIKFFLPWKNSLEMQKEPPDPIGELAAHIILDIHYIKKTVNHWTECFIWFEL